MGGDNIRDKEREGGNFGLKEKGRPERREGKAEGMNMEAEDIGEDSEGNIEKEY